MSISIAGESIDLWKIVIPLVGFASIVGIIITISTFKWPMFRRHGFPRWALTLAIAIGILSVVLEIGAVVGRIVTGIDFTWVVIGITTLIVATAALHVYNKRKEYGTLDPQKVIIMFALPLSPAGALVAYSAIWKGSSLLSLLP